MQSMRPGRFFHPMKAMVCVLGLPLFAMACSSSGSSATSGGLCTAMAASPCVGPEGCAGEMVCQPGGESFGACECTAATTTGGGNGTGTTGAQTSSSSTGGTTGGASTATTGATPQTMAIGTAITPVGPGPCAVTLTIDAIDLETTPTPGGTVSVSGTWNFGTSALTGSYDTASQVLSLTSPGYDASFTGMLAGGVISGDWAGGTYDWPFALVLVPADAGGYAFCGTSSNQSQSLGVAFSANGSAAAIEGPGPNMPSGSAQVISGTYSNGLASVSGIGSFIFRTNSDGGLSLTDTSAGWSMSECQ